MNEYHFAVSTSLYAAQCPFLAVHEVVIPTTKMIARIEKKRDGFMMNDLLRPTKVQ
jgi:hypothetical protein